MAEILEIRDLNANDIIKDVAKHICVDYDENHIEMYIRIPGELRSSYMKATKFKIGRRSIIDFRDEHLRSGLRHLAD